MKILQTQTSLTAAPWEQLRDRAMRPTKITAYESLLVVEGRGDFPFDMLRYDSCLPSEEKDSNQMIRSFAPEPRRIVLRRRSINATYGTPDRWRSFSWSLLLTTTDAHEARQLADGPR